MDFGMGAELFPYVVESMEKQSDIPLGVKQTNAPSFWQFAQGISPVVAVIDTGLDTAHVEFSGRIFNPKSLDGNPMNDSEGHGTHVAGTIAGATCGMIPWARIMPLKVCFGTRTINEQIHNAFLVIMDHNKACADKDKVVAVNCSFSGPADSIMAYYIRTLVKSGVSVVVAAGNGGDGDPDTEECFSYPAFIDEVITTGALYSNEKPTSFSNSFEGVDISALGTYVYSSWPGNGYRALSGTSMATPHVTGAVALIKAAFYTKYGRWPNSEETENILWKCIKPLNYSEKLVGRGMLYMPNQLVSAEQKQADVAPYIKGGRTMVPFRFMGEALGVTVGWGTAAKKVTAELGDKKIEMTIDSKCYSKSTMLF